VSVPCEGRTRVSLCGVCSFGNGEGLLNVVWLIRLPSVSRPAPQCANRPDGKLPRLPQSCSTASSRRRPRAAQTFAHIRQPLQVGQEGNSHRLASNRTLIADKWKILLDKCSGFNVRTLFEGHDDRRGGRVRHWSSEQGQAAGRQQQHVGRWSQETPLHVTSAAFGPGLHSSCNPPG